MKDQDKWMPLETPCGGDGLHQMRISIFSRTEDDDAIGMQVDCYDGSMRHLDPVHNPSPRRQGIRIVYSCEHCAVDHSLVMFQHKGVEYMKWEE